MLTNRKHYLRFLRRNKDTRKKTYIYDVENVVTGECIGFVFWHIPFRKYAWVARTDEIVMDANCLQDIQEFLNQLMEEHKIEKA